MRAFVTVGSTKFNDLVQTVLLEDTLQAFKAAGYTEVSVQCGNSSFEHSAKVDKEGVYTVEQSGVSISCWSYKPSLEEEYDRADLVISHAGVCRPPCDRS